jgi:hypothetical protein
MYLNLFVKRSKDPSDLLPYLAGREVEYQEVKGGDECDNVLREQIRGSCRVVVAWGKMAKLRGRYDTAVSRRVSEALCCLCEDLWCVGPPENGHPRHSRRWNFNQDRTLKRWRPTP